MLKNYFLWEKRKERFFKKTQAKVSHIKGKNEDREQENEIREEKFNI